MPALARRWTLVRPPSRAWSAALGEYAALGAWVLLQVGVLFAMGWLGSRYGVRFDLRPARLDDLLALDPGWMDPGPVATLVPYGPLLAALLVAAVASILLDRLLLRNFPGFFTRRGSHDKLAGQLEDSGPLLDEALEPGEIPAGAVELAPYRGWAGSGVGGAIGPIVLATMMIGFPIATQASGVAFVAAYLAVLVVLSGAWCWFSDREGGLPMLHLTIGCIYSGMAALVLALESREVPSWYLLVALGFLGLFVGLALAGWSLGTRELLLVTSRGVRRVRLGRAGVATMGALLVPGRIRLRPGRTRTRIELEAAGGTVLEAEPWTADPPELAALFAKAGLVGEFEGRPGATSLVQDLPALASTLALVALGWLGLLATLDANLDRGKLTAEALRQECRWYYQGSWGESGPLSPALAAKVEVAVRKFPDDPGLALMQVESRLRQGSVQEAFRLLGPARQRIEARSLENSWPFQRGLAFLEGRTGDARKVLARPPAGWDPTGPGRERFAAGLACWVGRTDAARYSGQGENGIEPALALFEAAIALEPAAAGPRLAGALALILGRAEAPEGRPPGSPDAALRARLAELLDPLAGHPAFGRAARRLRDARFEPPAALDARIGQAALARGSVPPELLAEARRAYLAPLPDEAWSARFLAPILDSADLEALLPGLASPLDPSP